MLQPLREVFARSCSMNKQPESCAARLQCSALTCYDLKACMAVELCNAQSPQHGVSALLLQALVLKAGPWRLILTRAWRPWLLALCHLQQCHILAAREGEVLREGAACPAVITLCRGTLGCLSSITWEHALIFKHMSSSSGNHMPKVQLHA